MSPKISVFIGTSADGFIARKDGGLDWLDHDRCGDDYGYMDFYRSVDVLVMGRLTFQKVSRYNEWPYKEKEVIVLSSTMTQESVPEHVAQHVRVSSLKPVELVGELLNEGKRHIYVDGGKTIQSFLRCGLLTEIIINRVPVLLGEGISPFGKLSGDIKLKLISSVSYRSGLVQTRYGVQY